MDSKTVATDMLNIVEKLGQDKLQFFGIVRPYSCLSWARY